MGQELLEKPIEIQQVNSAEATEDIVEAYPVPAGLTDALIARTDADVVMGNRSTSDDGAVNGNKRPSGSISSMMIATNELPLARTTSAAEVIGAAARFPTSSRAKTGKAVAMP